MQARWAWRSIHADSADWARISACEWPADSIILIAQRLSYRACHSASTRQAAVLHLELEARVPTGAVFSSRWVANNGSECTPFIHQACL